MKNGTKVRHKTKGMVETVVGSCKVKVNGVWVDDEGIECYWKGSYVCIPDFDDVLDFIGLSEEEMYEMFEKEN